MRSCQKTAGQIRKAFYIKKKDIVVVHGHDPKSNIHLVVSLIAHWQIFIRPREQEDVRKEVELYRPIRRYIGCTQSISMRVKNEDIKSRNGLSRSGLT